MMMLKISPAILRRQVLAATLVISVSGGSFIAFPPGADAQMRLSGRVSQTVRQANRLFELGKWEEAEKTYTQALKKNPRDLQARTGLAIVQAELYKLGAAEKNAQEVLKRDPLNAYAHIAQGLVYRNRTASSDMTHRNRKNDLLNQAIEEFRTALGYDPDNPDAYNRLGETYRLQGRLSDAEEAFTEAMKIDPAYSEAIANKGSVLRDQGKLDEAISHFQRAIRLNSKNYKAHYYLGDAYIAKGKYHEAYESLNTALYQDRNSAMVHTKMGEALEKQGNESAAIAKYREAIRLKPEYTPAYRSLARLFDSRGDGEFAMAELRSALNANPNMDALKLELGRLSLAVNKPDQALRYYDEVLRKNPYHAEALQGLAQAYMVTAQDTAGQGILGGADKYVDAEMAIGKALQASPDDISLHLAMLKIQKLAGEPEMARGYYEQIARLAPQTDTERIAMGEALFALGRYQDSDHHFRQLLYQYGNDTGKKLLLADALKTNGDLDLATEAYRQILQGDPQNIKAQRGLQRIEKVRAEANKTTNLANSFNNWYSSKQRKSAKDFFLESASLYPRQPEVRLALARIYDREDDYGKAAIEYEAYMNLRPDLSAKERAKLASRIDRLWNKAAKRPDGLNGSSPAVGGLAPMQQTPISRPSSTGTNPF